MVATIDTAEEDQETAKFEIPQARPGIQLPWWFLPTVDTDYAKASMGKNQEFSVDVRVDRESQIAGRTENTDSCHAHQGPPCSVIKGGITVSLHLIVCPSSIRLGRIPSNRGAARTVPLSRW
jgi:hypothetical protein